MTFLVSYFRRGGPAVLALLLLAGSPAVAQVREQPHAVAPLPLAAPRATRPPSAERLRELHNDSDLRYRDVTATPEQPGLLARLLWWLLQLIDGVRSTSGGRAAWNVVFYGLGIGILVFAVLKFLQIDITRLFGRSSRKAALDYETSQENIHELNFVDVIGQAEASGNLRLALRLGYLELLKQLTDAGLIDWQPDKTNQTYLRELGTARPDLRPDFATLTRQFEYVWYGEWPLTAASYRPLRESQQALGYGLRQKA